MKNQPFIVPLLGLILGICFSEFIPEISLSNLHQIFLLIFVLLLLVFLGIKHQFTTLILVFFISLGWIFSSQYNKLEEIPDKHRNQTVLIHAKVKEIYRHSEKYKKYKIEFLHIDSTNYSGRFAILYVKKNAEELFLNQEIWLNSKIQNPQKALNPHQFDYSKFLKRRKIHYSIFVDSVLHTQTNEKSFAFLSSKFKRNIHSKLISNGYNKQVADQIGAMLLGDRTEMDAEVEENYRKTGVVHILAISGLHVMMVYSIFYLLLFPVSYLKNGKTLRIFISLLLIWSFVIFVGFHPPVFRSAIMIAVYHITVATHRKPNVYHTLAISALILLLINPNFLFEPGFQLSFSAVFFIVFFHKALWKFNVFRSKMKKSMFNFVATCVSAQAGTLPFSVYYFNQTSGLFLAGNLVMILASYLMIAGGLLTVFLLTLGLNFSIWTTFFNGFITSCNVYIQWLASFETFVFDAVRMNFVEGVLFIIGLFLVRFLMIQPKAKYMISFLMLVFIFQSQRLYRNHLLNTKNEIVVFQQYKNSVIGIRKGNQMLIYIQNLEDTVSFQKYSLKSYEIHQNIEKIRFKEMDKFPINKQDSSVYVLYRNNLNADSLELNSRIILDGSSYPNHSENFAHNTVWDTKMNGALTISLKKTKGFND